MKTIIAGSRTIEDYEVVKTAILESGFEITEVVSGGAQGVDALGAKYAIENDIILTKFFAEWKTLGKAAGPIRNAKMAAYSEALIAVWDGESRGTADMIQRATAAGLKVFIHKLK